MKLSLMKILESIFDPELPSGRNSHMFIQQNHPKGPNDFPYNHSEETLDEEDIKKELKLEFKTSRVMKDPTNLSNHNIHNGSFSNGKGSNSFADYQFNLAGENDPSIHDATVQKIPEEKNSDIPEEWKPYFENQKKAFKDAENAKPKKRSKDSFSLWDAFKPPKTIKSESDIGLREKGRAYGQPQPTTKQPLASGVPKKTDLEFWSDEEIDKELGLKEYISSMTVINKKVHSPKADLRFFEDENDSFIMNTEEEFNKNQKKRIHEKKSRSK